MKFRKRPSEDFDINITPLIDVVFLLLIFFMVSTTFERQSQVKVELPQATTEEIVDQSAPLQLTINRNGDYFINGLAVGSQQLPALRNALQQATATLTTPPKVLINADKESQHQAVITAIDALAQLNLNQIIFATRQGEP